MTVRLRRPTRAAWLLGVLLLASTASAESGDDIARGALGGQTAFTTDRTGPVSDRPWWLSFEDSALDTLLRRALQDSPDIALQVALAEQARMNGVTQMSGLMPSVSFDASVSGSPTDALGFQFGGFGSAPSTVDVLIGMDTLQDITGDGIPDKAFDPLYQTVEIPASNTDTSTVTWNGSALLNARWNLDIFGNQVQAWQASRHTARASSGDRDATALTIATTVSGAWYDLVLSRARLDVVREQLDANEQLMELVQLRYEAGSASALEVLQQRQQLAATQALLPAAEHGIRRTTYRLAVLIGANPAELANSLTAGNTLPTVPPPPAVGTPADLLRNRPDVAAAAARVDAAVANRKGTVRDALPTLGVSANVGWQYFSQGDWKSTDIWGIGASASVPLFNGGRVYSQSKAAQASERASIESARRTVLSAVQEVEDALLFEDQAAAELVATETRREAARLAYEDARERYIHGLADLTTVLTTLTAWQNAELSWLTAQRTRIGARIQLHDALGGPWTRTLAASGEAQ
jgi:NodT family efflux transporter outer membrane factor (OMF) lipoprotein